MKYGDLLLTHFFNPQNVGEFAFNETGVGRSQLGSYQNGAVICFAIKVKKETIIDTKFKAYGNCPIIAACSYATEWLKNKTLSEVTEFCSEQIMSALAMPRLQVHCALLVAGAVKQAILNYKDSCH